MGLWGIDILGRQKQTHFSVIKENISVWLSFVKLFSVVSLFFQCGWTYQRDFQCHILIVHVCTYILLEDWPEIWCLMEVSTNVLYFADTTFLTYKLVGQYSFSWRWFVSRKLLYILDWYFDILIYNNHIQAPITGYINEFTGDNNCEQFVKQYTPWLLHFRKGNEDVVVCAKGVGLLETLWQDNRYDLVFLYRSKIYVPLYDLFFQRKTLP